MAEIHRWPCGPYRGGHTTCSFPSELASDTWYCVAPCPVVFKFRNMASSGLNRPSWKTEPVKPYQKLPHPDWSRLLFDVSHESATKLHFIITTVVVLIQPSLYMMLSTVQRWHDGLSPESVLLDQSQQTNWIPFHSRQSPEQTDTSADV